VNHTYRENGSLEWGDHVLIKSNQMNATLVTDTSDRVNNNDEAYGVTTTARNPGAIARSVFVLERGDEKDGSPDNCVHFGQKVRVRSN
jgi:hypothetical protein